jgi:hypothetical protein
MSKVQRIYPEAKTGLINWIEENFHDIDSFVVTFSMKDNTTMTIYHCNTFLESLGIVGISQSTLNELATNEEFIPKPKE